MLGQPVTGQVVAGDAVPVHAAAGRDARPARAGPGRRGLIDHYRGQEALLAERPDDGGHFRAQQIETDSVHPDDQDVA
jgi:hypothetical protein